MPQTPFVRGVVAATRRSNADGSAEITACTLAHRYTAAARLGAADQWMFGIVALVTQAKAQSALMRKFPWSAPDTALLRRRQDKPASGHAPTPEQMHYQGNHRYD